MTKDPFKVVTDDESNMCYIVRAIDEETKNHKESNSEIISGYMHKIQGNKFCPVQLYLTYKISLDTRSEYLWQKPRMKKIPADGKGTWFGPQQVGHNTIDGFITNIAEKYGMKDKGYSNHSLRATAITSLTRHNFSNKQIMSLTGHKSMSSLAIYQKVNSNEKLRMGFTLGINQPNPAIPRMPVQAPPIQQNPPPLPTIPTVAAIQSAPQIVQNKENVTETNALVPFHYEAEDPLADATVPSFDIMEILDDVQNEEMIAESQVASKCNNVEVSKQQIVKKTSPKVPMMFSGCTINSNVTINLPK